MSASSLLSKLSKSWAIALKDMRIYFLRAPTMISGLLFPIALFFSFAVGRNLSNQELIPVLAAQTMLWSSSSIGPPAFALERRTRTFERYLSAPLSLFSVLWGKTIAGMIFGIGITAAATTIGALWIGLPLMNLLAAILGILLSAVVFSWMGTLFAAIPTENPGEVIMPLNLVRIPLMFVSGMFIPIDALPPAGAYAALVSPLTHGLDLLRLGFGGISHFGWTTNVAVLIVWIVALTVVSNFLHRFFMKRR